MDCEYHYSLIFFSDIPHTEPLLEDEPKSKGGKKKVQTHTFSDFPDDDEESDKADVRMLLYRYQNI